MELTCFSVRPWQTLTFSPDLKDIAFGNLSKSIWADLEVKAIQALGAGNFPAFPHHLRDRLTVLVEYCAASWADMPPSE